MTPTNTPTHLRYTFNVLFNSNINTVCIDGDPIVIYGENSAFDMNTEFFNNIYGSVTIDMSGYYVYSGQEVQLDVNGLVVSPFTLCSVIITRTPTQTPTNTPTNTPTQTQTPTSTTPLTCGEFTFTGNNVTTTINSAINTTSGGWISMAYSLETYSGPVSVTFQTSTNGNYLMGGFSINPTAHPTNTYTDTTYGIYLQNNFVEIYEYGSQVSVPGSISTLSTDVWKVDYNGTNVKYYKNNNLIYTSSNPVTQPLHIFFPLLTGNEGVTNVCVIS